MCGGFISEKKKTNNEEELLRAGDWDTVWIANSWKLRRAGLDSLLVSQRQSTEK